MEEAEYLCDRIGVISGGQLKIIGTMDELRAATGKQRLREIFLDLLGLPQDRVKDSLCDVPCIQAIYRKEMLDLLRDRRTMISMVVVPVVVFPADDAA